MILLSLAPGRAPGEFIAEYDPGRPTTVNLTWTAVPSEHRNGVLRGYTVTVVPSQGAGEALEANVTSNQESLQLDNLVPNTLYNFSIAAFTSIGRGPSSTTQVHLLPRGVLSKAEKCP